MRVFVTVVLLLTAIDMTAQSCADPPTVEGTECPIVINFENGLYRLTGAESPVTFDIEATGHPLHGS